MDLHFSHNLKPCSVWKIKGIVHQKIKIIYSLFTHHQPVWMSLFCWTQRKIFWRMWETEQFWGTIDFHSIFFSHYGSQWCPKQPDYKLSSTYIPLCSAEQRNSYRFGITWGWVNDDRIFIFGWTIPLRKEGFTDVHLVVYSDRVSMKSKAIIFYRILQCLL